MNVFNNKLGADSTGQNTSRTVMAAGLLLVSIATQAQTASEARTLNLAEYMQIVAGENLQIQSSELNVDISQYTTQEQEGSFDTELYASFKRETNKQRNTVQESLSLSSLSEYESDDRTYTVGLKKYTQTGATLEFDVSNQRLTNNVQPDYIHGEEVFISPALRVRQPLLRGSWKASTYQLEMAEKGEKVAYQEFRQLRLEESYRAVEAYWSLYQAQGRLAIRGQSEALLEKMLDVGKQRAKLGNIPLTDVLRVESRLASEKAIITHGSQRLVEATNRVKGYMAVSSRSSQSVKIAQGDLVQVIEAVNKPKLDYVQSLKSAYAFNPGYLSIKQVAERDNLELAFAKDEQQAVLDLVGSYRLNGLDRNTVDASADAFSGDYPGWMVGVEFRIPIANNVGKSLVGSASAEKQQTLYRIKEKEINLSNRIATLNSDIRNKYENMQQLNNVRDINQRLFKINEKTYRKGKLSIDDLIDSERRMWIAHEELLSSYVGYQKSLFLLRQVEGQLLTELGITDHKSLDAMEAVPS